MKLRFALIGGAAESFIGPVHRIAATMDGQAELVAGAFSRNPEKNTRTGLLWHITPDRLYTDYRKLLEAERDHLDYVIIATPNDTHVEIATAAIDAGLSVSCDKPLGRTFAEAHPLVSLLEKNPVPFMVTYNYSGYSMIKEARQRCEDNELGEIRRVVVEMPQGWLQGLVARAGTEPNVWRMDPAVSGPSLTTADVGTHALHLAEYVTGLTVISVGADITAFLSSSALENDANVLLRFANGAKGILTASQIATGDRNPFRLRVYGTKMGLEWNQDLPERLVMKDSNGNERHIFRAADPDSTSARWSRVAAGHPEGYLEAFANVYHEFHRAIRDHQSNSFKSGDEYDYPGVDAGIHGLKFVQAVLRSAQKQDSSCWVSVSAPQNGDHEGE